MQLYSTLSLSLSLFLPVIQHFSLPSFFAYFCFYFFCLYDDVSFLDLIAILFCAGKLCPIYSG